MRTGDTIEEPRVVITCRARLTGPRAYASLSPSCIGSYSLAIGLSPRTLLFCRPHSITLADYSALSTCKRPRISTGYSVADPLQASRAASPVRGDNLRRPHATPCHFILHSLSGVKLAYTPIERASRRCFSLGSSRVKMNAAYACSEITRRILARASVNVRTG